MLGKKVRDKVSGFVGTCTAEVQYLHGSPQFEVTANEVGRDGDVTSKWFDTSRVALYEEPETGETLPTR